MQQFPSEDPIKKIPVDIICPITFQIMNDPVMLVESGNTYERESILQWLEKNNTDPLTNEKISNKTIAPNRAIKRLIISFLEENKQKTPDIMYETYLSDSLIQEIITNLEKNQIDLFSQTLDKNSQLLINELKDNKNLFMLSCELASLEILRLVLKKLSGEVLNFSCVKSDKGLSMFLMVSRRLGLEGARILSTAFQWAASDIQDLLNNALKDNDVEIAKISLSLGATVNFEVLNQLYIAKQTEMLKALILAGSAINEKDKTGNDFLLRSIQEDYTEFSVFLILEAPDKVNPNNINDAQETALHLAVQKNKIKMVEILLNHPQINIHQKNNKNDTALQIAVRNGYLKISALLIEMKADVNVKTEQGETLLEIAYKNKDIKLQKLLARSDVEIGNLLIQAITDWEKEQKSLIQFLLTEVTHPIDINRDISGKSALMLASEEKQAKIVRLLLNQKNINSHKIDETENFAAISSDTGEEEYIMGNKFFMRSRYLKSLPYFEKSAEKKYPAAYLHLARMYRDGDMRLSKDQTKSDMWYQKVVSEINWFKDQAEKGSADAQYNLGILYNQGKGVIQDYKMAVKYYQMAAAQGYGCGQSALGLCYLNGEGVSQDENMAVKYYQMAAEQRLPIAQYSLGLCYANGKGVMQNSKKAVKYFQMAADQGDAYIQYRLARRYEDGEGVVMQDYKLAVKYFQMAADQGDANAQHSLGHCYRNGKGVTQDYKMAVKYFQMAADQGVANAQYSLGLRYANGEGVMQDYKLAVKYFQMAADQGASNAQYSLGLCYKNGEGVTQDYKMAIKYFQMAADQGNGNAKTKLNVLLQKQAGIKSQGENQHIIFPQVRTQENQAGKDNSEKEQNEENCLMM